MKIRSKIAVGLALVFGLMMVVVGVPAAVNAQVVSAEQNSGTSTVIYPYPVYNPGYYGNSGFGNNLGSLFTLGRLFNCDPILGCSPGTNLGSLFILDQLFGASVGTPALGNSLGSLFTLNGLFGGVYSNGLLSGGNATIGNLLILDQLFR